MKSYCMVVEIRHDCMCRALGLFLTQKQCPLWRQDRCLLLRQDRCLLLRQDRCLLLRQDRCLLLRQDKCPLVRQGAALSHHFTFVSSQQKTSVLSQQQTSVLSQQQTSVLSHQMTSVLSQHHIVCVSETGQGPDTCNRDGSRQPYSNFSNRPHPQRQNRGAVRMGMAVWRVTEKLKKIKWQWGQDVRYSTRAEIGESCRKWPQNGRQRLSAKP